ncbi:hypothetical protein [Komarekiella delphini-convector]|uniref:hypothetical protein n=1 Tax=Komarekiella delphini-convector TaxID=3050158 RepID=UPI0017841CFA|nr:hypothetical protein [Komarekiella delphini-convector]
MPALCQCKLCTSVDVTCAKIERKTKSDRTLAKFEYELEFFLSALAWNQWL